MMMLLLFRSLVNDFCADITHHGLNEGRKGTENRCLKIVRREMAILGGGAWYEQASRSGGKKNQTMCIFVILSINILIFRQLQ